MVMLMSQRSKARSFDRILAAREPVCFFPYTLYALMYVQPPPPGVPPNHLRGTFMITSHRNSVLQFPRLGGSDQGWERNFIRTLPHHWGDLCPAPLHDPLALQMDIAMTRLVRRISTCLRTYLLRHPNVRTRIDSSIYRRMREGWVWYSSIHVRMVCSDLWFLGPNRRATAHEEVVG